MKSRLLWLAVALAGTALAQQQPQLASAVNNDPNAQQARELLQQCIQALGGPAYLNQVDFEESGRNYAFDHGQPEGAGVLYWLFGKWPEMQRVELTKQRDVIYIYNGPDAYEKTFKGVAPLEGKDMQEYLRQRDFALDLILRRWINQPDVAFFYEGKVFVNSTQADQVSLLNGNNQGVTLDLDSLTHLPVKKSCTVRDPHTADRDTYDEVYANYHLVQGIQTPFDLTRLHNGEMTRQRFINHVSYNNNLSDSMFTATVTYNPGAKRH